MKKEFLIFFVILFGFIFGGVIFAFLAQSFCYDNGHTSNPLWCLSRY